MPNLQPLVDAIAQRGDVVLIALVLFALIGSLLFGLTLRLLWRIVQRTFQIVEGNTQASTMLKGAVEANTAATNANTAAVSTIAMQLAVLQAQVNQAINPAAPHDRRR